MAIDKKSVIGIVENLPEDATMDDLIHELFVRMQIEDGLHQSAEGKTISDEELKRRMSKWLAD